MPARPANFDRSLGFILSDISRLARREFDRRVRSLRLTRAQWLFLYHLGREAGCTQSEMAERLQMERISVSRQAERLERAGWIRRLDSREDGRAYRLHLTPRAERMVDRLAEAAEQLREEYLQGIPAARREQLIDDLLHIKANLLRMEGTPSHSHEDPNQ